MKLENSIQNTPLNTKTWVGCNLIITWISFLFHDNSSVRSQFVWFTQLSHPFWVWHIPYVTYDPHEYEPKSWPKVKLNWWWNHVWHVMCQWHSVTWFLVLNLALIGFFFLLSIGRFKTHVNHRPAPADDSQCEFHTARCTGLNEANWCVFTNSVNSKVWISNY